MRNITIFIILMLVIFIWAKLCPDKKITIQAKKINEISRKLFLSLKTWGNNRLQTSRLKNDLNDYLNFKIQDSFLEGDSNKYYYMKKHCNKLLIFNLHHKKKVLIPCGSPSQSRWFVEELNTLIKNDLNHFFPSLYWNEPVIKRIRFTSYFYYVITEK